MQDDPEEGVDGVAKNVKIKHFRYKIIDKIDLRGNFVSFSMLV